MPTWAYLWILTLVGKDRRYYLNICGIRTQCLDQITNNLLGVYFISAYSEV